MSLQGSLETFSIPDVLVLLSSTKKTGELRVVGGQVDGRLWFEGGSLVQAAVGGSPVAPVDGVFEILRLLQGTFSFNTDVKASNPGGPQPVEMVLADAQARLSEWHDIAKVVPHLDCTVALSPELPGEQVTVDRSQWSLMVAVAGGASVRQLMESTGLSEFDACKAVRNLISADLVAIDTSVKPRSGRAEAPKSMTVEVDDTLAAKDAEAAGGRAKANGVNGAGDAGSKSASVTPEKKPTTAAEAAQRAGKDDQVIRSNASSSGTNRPVSATKASPTTELSGDDDNDKRAKADAAKAGAKGSEKSRAVEENPLVAQLAALGVDEDDEEMQAKVARHLAQGGELPEPEGDEPINRGLLLKFLSSVRN